MSTVGEAMPRNRLPRVDVERSHGESDVRHEAFFGLENNLSIASRLSRASKSRANYHAPRRPKKYGTQCHVTGESECPASRTSLESLKPILDSTECGGELKIVLKEFTQLLVCDDEFSRDMEREINEQRKSAHKSILVCHFTLATQA